MDTIVGHNGNVLVLSLNFYKGLKVFIVRPSRKNNFTITPEALVIYTHYTKIVVSFYQFLIEIGLPSLMCMPNKHVLSSLLYPKDKLLCTWKVILIYACVKMIVPRSFYISSTFLIQFYFLLHSFCIFLSVREYPFLC